MNAGKFKFFTYSKRSNLHVKFIFYIHIFMWWFKVTCLVLMPTVFQFGVCVCVKSTIKTLRHKILIAVCDHTSVLSKLGLNSAPDAETQSCRTILVLLWFWIIQRYSGGHIHKVNFTQSKATKNTDKDLFSSTTVIALKSLQTEKSGQEENRWKCRDPLLLSENPLTGRKREGWEGLAWFSKLLFAYLSLCLHKQLPLRGVNQPFNKALTNVTTWLIVYVK